MLSKKIIELNAKVYDEYYDESIYDGWDIADKIFNYKYLFKIQELTGKNLKNASILDVGCGTGSLLEHFTEASNLKQNDLGKYLGIDIYRPALKIARRNFKEVSNVEFRNVDLLKNLNLSQFDYCFASGTLSLKLKKKISEFDNYEFLKGMVEKMYSLAIWGVAFNFLTDKNKKSSVDGNLFYYNVKEVKNICGEFCSNVKTRNNPLKSYSEIGKPQEYEDQETVYLIKNVKNT